LRHSAAKPSSSSPRAVPKVTFAKTPHTHTPPHAHAHARNTQVPL
jgi:hypothetical protein